MVRVRLFAGLRERAGRSELELELPDDACVGEALAAVADLTAGVPVVMAVNREYADEGDRLSPGDEPALIPPGSGGAPVPAGGGPVSRRVRGGALAGPEPLARAAFASRARAPRAGALFTFSGVTRE